MKRIILVDGNNLMFRSYFATIYSGVVMKNSKGFPTNALYGLSNMINKIIDEEKPTYMVVAFDIGKNFRHESYSEYKAGRQETPQELKDQFPKAKELLTAMGIKYLEKEMYEADDIIGTVTRMCLEDDDFVGTIVSSDRDLLQLINHETDVKLLKTKDFIRYNPDSFKADYGIEPIKIIDMKALSGDSSDNIPGVKGIGEKTALKLLQEYGSLENIYANIDNIKGAVQIKLKNDRESAFFSKNLATICQEVPLNIKLEDLKYEGPNVDEVKKIYEELEFFSFLKNMKIPKIKEELKYELIKDINDIDINNDYSFYIECDNSNYHSANILGMGLYDGFKLYYIENNLIKAFFDKFNSLNKYTFDLKKNYHLLKHIGVDLDYCYYDLMIALYLLNINIKDDDLAYLLNSNGFEISFYDELLKKHLDDQKLIINEILTKTKYIYDTKEKYLKDLKNENMQDLFINMEIPLTKVLFDMEDVGIVVHDEVLKEQQESIIVKLDMISNDIYNLCGEKFNIASPKQLGEVLFEKMGLPYPKKNSHGYKTDVTILQKIFDVHPVISKILEYRNLSKINSTYLEGLYKYIHNDKKIHTIYKQTLTRTGRLSSVEPNLQNIPVREEEGRKIRKAFYPSNDCVLLSADYSQIELRILAHISGDETLINAFIHGEDIHTKVASDMYGVPIESVTKEMRKSAKAVIFGIVYGISGFGLGENLQVSAKEAKKFIDKYYELYPNVRKYMDDIIIKAKENGYVHTLYNRKRVINELNDHNFMVKQAGERIALNTPIQGSSADIIKMAMIDIYNELNKRDMKSKMILQVHDELIFDCLLTEKEELEKIVKDKMENVVKLSVPLKVEVETGSNWYEV